MCMLDKSPMKVASRPYEKLPENKENSVNLMMVLSLDSDELGMIRTVVKRTMQKSIISIFKVLN